MRHNGRAPIKASRMRPEHLNLREGETPLAVCPDCESWHRLTRSMISPHRDSSDKPVKSGERRYFGDKPERRRRCPGSAQRITIDLTPEQWGQALLAADSTAAGRHSARVTRKPRTAVPTPVTRLASLPAPSARLLAVRDQARAAVHVHRSECEVCRTGRARCPVGRELEIRAGHTDASVRFVHEQHEVALRAMAVPAAPRRRQWRRVNAAVKRTDQQRSTRPAGDAPKDGGPSVPETPVRITA
ncbi:hypothetical protein [Streptomyces parvulus]|uniref:hypothetical protein n=1 Tax=Streptomyces parvulus TaxID=146923 RepID=UPI0033BBCF7B